MKERATTATDYLHKYGSLLEIHIAWLDCRDGKLDGLIDPDDLPGISCMVISPQWTTAALIARAIRDRVWEVAK